MARRGRDGKTPTFRGKFDTHERYNEFDIVTADGFAYITDRDNPDATPGGKGWEIVARQGRPGIRGDHGSAGARGLKGMKGRQGQRRSGNC